MPIKGITDRPVTMSNALSTVAILHKGSEKGSNKPGKDLKYFRVTWEPGYEYLAPLFEDIYTKEPSEFHGVYVIGQTPDEAFPTWMESWSRTTLKGRSDGETVFVWFDEATQTYSHEPQPYKESDWLDKDGNLTMQNIGRLSFIFPELLTRSGIMGKIRLNVGSFYDITEIYQTLTGLYQLTGNLQSIPFVLGRADRQVSAPVNGKRAMVTKSLLYMHPTPEHTKSQLIPALASGSLQSDTPQLTAGVDYDDDTGEVYEDDVIDAPQESNPFYDEPWHAPSAADLQKFSEYIHANINSDMQLSDVLEGLQELYPTLIDSWDSLGEVGITKAFVVAVAINIHCDWEIEAVTQFVQGSNNDTFAYLMDTITAQQEMRMASFQF